MLTYLQQTYGKNLNAVLYPQHSLLPLTALQTCTLDRVTALLASDQAYPDKLPTYEESSMITVSPQRPLNYQFVVHLNQDLCAQYGGSPGVRDAGRLAFACDYPAQGWYSELAMSAAKLIEFIVCGHLFVDGNKRTGYHAMVLFCASNGYLLESEYPEAGRDAILALCTHQWSVNQLAGWINDNLIERW